MLDPRSIRDLILPELRAALSHQQRRRLRFRMPLSVIDEPLAAARQLGLALADMRGGWQVGSVPLSRRARRGLRSTPMIQCGATVFMVDSEERAVELAGLLNWCEVGEGDLAEEPPPVPPDPSPRGRPRPRK